MNARFFSFLKRSNGWRLWAVVALILLLLIELIVAVMDVALKGGVMSGDLLIGAVAAGGVAAFGIAFMHYLLRELPKEENRQLVRSAKHANARLSMALENAQMMIWELDLVEDKLLYEDDMLGLLGMAKTDAPHTISGMAERIHPDDRANFMAQFNDALSDAAPPFNLEYRVARHDGEWGWVHCSGKVIQRDASGTPLLMVGCLMNINARKQAAMQLLEEKTLLAEREALFHHIFAQANEGIVLIDPETRGFVEFNDVVCRTLGYSRAEFSRLTVADIQAEMDTTDIANKFQSLADEGAAEFETLHRRKDGTLCNERISCRPISLKGHSYVVAIWTDITERKRAEAALLASEQKLLTILDNVDAYIYLKDTGGRYLFANRRVRELWRMEMADIVGCGDEKFFDSATSANIRVNDERVLRGGETIKIEETNTVSVTGKTATYLSVKLPLRREDGSIYALCGISTDITERKLLEESLRNSEEKYRKAFNTNPDAINITRLRDGMYLDVNSGFEHMVGFRRDEVIGKTSVELNIWHNLADRKRLMDGLNKDGVYTNLEADFNAKNGTVINGLMSAAIIQAGDEDCIITITRDITEHRRVLDQLRRTADQLAQTNAQLEAERATLAQRVERRTRQLLLANKAKDSFLATMSHEIRTPLGGLLGMMELLGLSQLQPHQSELLAAAQTSGNSLLRIVNDILDWSKIEAGKLELAPRPATFTDMLRSVVNTYAQIATEKDIRLSYSIDPELRGAHLFDPLRLSQILNNFTSNALKFTASGTIHLSAQRLTHHTGYDTVRFSVTDSGIGIDPEHRARLFQHYEQASADTARMYGGTGLGLSICRRLAELMDGELSVDSTPGVGSTFSLTLQLPIANVALAADPQQPTAPDPEPDTSPLVAPGQTLAVLMVDDHPLNRMLLKQQLGLLGLHPDAAADGVEALALWQSHHYDLIITDCHMPEMDGYELTRTIRDIERHTGARRIPIIAWTANVLAEEQHRCQAAGMDDLLTKPTELAELRAKLAHWLAKARLLPATGPSVPPAAPPRTTPAAAVLDLGVLNKISTRRDAQIEMLQEFKLHNRSDIASLQAALKAGDPVAVVQAAHRGKGACRMVGALELAGLCADIEQTARQGALPEAGVADRLEAAVGRVEAEIGKLV